MRTAKSPSLSLPRKATAPMALSCALAFAGIAQAQSYQPSQQQGFQQPFQFQPNVSTIYGQSAYGQTGFGATEEQRPPSTRSIFAVTIAALVAQGIGTGIASGLSQGIGGSILKWFTGGESQATPEQSPVSPGPASSDNAERSRERQRDTAATAPAHAGLAYEIHQLDRDGSSTAIDPSRHVFRTGDRFQLHYRPTMPGRVEVFNINPHGARSRVDAIMVAAGQLVALGPYEFVDAQGDETLKLVLSPCSTPALMDATRTIVRVSDAKAAAMGTAATGSTVALADCGDVRTRGLHQRKRSIRKVSVEGGTAFALDPLSREEMASGVLAPRELKIRLQHR